MYLPRARATGLAPWVLDLIGYSGASRRALRRGRPGTRVQPPSVAGAAGWGVVHGGTAAGSTGAGSPAAEAAGASTSGSRRLRPGSWSCLRGRRVRTSRGCRLTTLSSRGPLSAVPETTIPDQKPIQENDTCFLAPGYEARTPSRLAKLNIIAISLKRPGALRLTNCMSRARMRVTGEHSRCSTTATRRDAA